MPRVICDLPNASDEINGIKFHPLDDGGRISDEIDAETAAHFVSIPGYALDDGSAAPEPVKVAPAPTKRQAKATAKPVKVVTEAVVPPADAAGETEKPAGSDESGGDADSGAPEPTEEVF